MKSRPAAVIVLSGGQDSTTCLAQALLERERILAVTFDYHQRHSKEIISAREIARRAGVLHEVIFVGDLLKGTSPLVNKAQPVEQYADAQSLPGGLEKTFVPMRNTLFLTLAANRAVVFAQERELPAIDLITGLSMEDYGGYPDCREDFVEALAEAFRQSLDDHRLPQLFIEAPLMHLSKADTVRLSETTLAPLARELLAYSHTCYNGLVPPCGQCHACLLRAKGYAETGYLDPLLERLGLV